MRAEKRAKLGDALGIAKKRHGELDCIESEDIIAVFKPGSKTGRDTFGETELRPLLRQAIVAACAAVETFVGDRVMERFGAAINADSPPERLLRLPLTLGDYVEIEAYQRPGWGLRKVIGSEVRRQYASASPGQIGIAFSLVGEKDLWKRVDKHRGVNGGFRRRHLSASTAEEISSRTPVTARGMVVRPSPSVKLRATWRALCPSLTHSMR